MALKWTGLDAELRALANLPLALQRDTAAIIETMTERAQAAIVQIYARGPTGNLRRGVRIEMRRFSAGTVGRVRSRAPHAWMYENGTVVRRWKTRNKRTTGQMAGKAVFIPTMIRLRREMQHQFVELLRKHGASKVTSAA